MLSNIKFNLNSCVMLMAAGLLMMASSAFSIEMVSAAYGYDVDEFDLATEMMFGDLTLFELMTEFTLPLAFICGAFLAAGGMSGWLLFDRRNSMNSVAVA